MLFGTESGSIYEIHDGKIRRKNSSHEKRGDGEWITLREIPTIRVGQRAILVLECLSDYGPDDYENTVQRDRNSVTSRVTTEVTWVEYPS